MQRCIRLFALFLLAATPIFAAPPSPLIFEISFAKEVSAAPVDGRILLIISKDSTREPRFTITEEVDSQQMFGVDVDGWQSGALARVDATTFGYPLESLNDLPAGIIPCKRY